MLWSSQSKDISFEEPVALFPGSVVDPEGPLFNRPSALSHREVGQTPAHEEIEPNGLLSGRNRPGFNRRRRLLIGRSPFHKMSYFTNETYA